jgi:hypothetical protein
MQDATVQVAETRNPGLEFAVECLELLPDFGLGPTPDLLPDPAAGR